jgi:hypothetical protein
VCLYIICVCALVSTRYAELRRLVRSSFFCLRGKLIRFCSWLHW